MVIHSSFVLLCFCAFVLWVMFCVTIVEVTMVFKKNERNPISHGFASCRPGRANKVIEIAGRLYTL